MTEALSTDAAERAALQDFDFLRSDHGFTGPVIRRGPFSLSIDYLQEVIAIELAFDWRDADLSILLVRLEDGHLPNGYYVSNGRRCRMYLATWLARNGRYESPVHNRRGQRRRSPDVSPLDALKEQLVSSRNLLAANMDFIKEYGSDAFEA